MNNQLIKINNTDLLVKEFKGQRVVTFKDIDMLHERVEGTAKRNFNENKEHLIKDIDYFEVRQSDVQRNEIRTLEIPNRGITFLTESGYLMLVKSLQDDLAWKVQRELVNNYFRVKDIVNDPLNKSVDLKQKEIEARYNNSLTRKANLYLKIATINPNLPKEYVQVLQSKAAETLNDGNMIIPLPKAERKTYTAGEIGEQLGISPNKVGRLANENNLKTDEYGIEVWDKSKYSNKEVQTFRYYDNVIPVLKKLLNQEVS